MSRLRGLGSSWFWSLVAEVASRLGALLTLLAYFRFLGEEPTGVVLLGISYSMTAWLLVDLGLGLYGTKQVASAPQDARTTYAEITKARLVFSAVVAIPLYAVLNGYLGAPPAVTLSFVIYIAGRAMAAEWYFRGLERFRDLAKISVAASAAQLVSAAVIVRLSNWELTAALPWTIWAMVMLAGSLIVARLPLSNVIAAPLRDALFHVRTSYQFSLTNGVSTVFGQSPVIILSMFFSAAELASFALVHRVVLSSNLLFQTMGAVVFPRIIRALKVDRGDAADINGRIVLVSALLSAMIGLLFMIAYLIPVIRETYLSGLSLATLAAMVLFLIARSVRESFMRLLLAGDGAGLTSRLMILWFGVFLTICTFGAVSGLVSVTYVAIAFAATEILITGSFFRVARRTST